MTIHWGSFWLGIGVLTVCEFLFFWIYIALAERRTKKAIKETEWGKG